jgi:hypothetical protein
MFPANGTRANVRNAKTMRPDKKAELV